MPLSWNEIKQRSALADLHDPLPMTPDLVNDHAAPPKPLAASTIRKISRANALNSSSFL